MDHTEKHGGLLTLAAVAPFLAMMPVVGLVVLALQGTSDHWPHIIGYVLPDALWQTAILLAGTGALAVVVGLGTAWLVTSFSFPGRRLLEWALLLPLAMPTYIVAYSYLDVLHTVGPVQTALRFVLGVTDLQGLVLPDIRSMAGCILVMGFVLYPYVYVTTRAALLTHSAEAIEAARGLGAGGLTLFRRVTLPIAAPALGVGLGLAMLEVVADIGASEFLGVRTMTVAVYVTWTTRGSVEGAAQIALAMLVITFGLLALERSMARRRDRGGGAGERQPLHVSLHGGKGWLAFAACLAPVGLGFLIPALHLVVNAAVRVAEFGMPAAMAGWIWNSASLAAIATVGTVLVGFLLAFCHRHIGGVWATAFLRVSSIGYALPGTVLALGMLGPMAWFDGLLATMLGWIGIHAGLLLSGSAGALVIAYMLRFMTIPVNTLEAGYGRIPYSVDDAARGLGAPDRALALRLHVPLLTPAGAAAALLVLIDCMKELPATMLLRPLNVDTLATALYAEASRGTYEDGAVAALAIVLVGMVPVILLVRGIRPRQARQRREALRVVTATG